MIGVSFSTFMTMIKAEAERPYELGKEHGDDRRLKACGRLEALEDDMRASVQDRDFAGYARDVLRSADRKAISEALRSIGFGSGPCCALTLVNAVAEASR